MSPIALSNIMSLITLVIAQSTFPPTPLASKHFAYPTGIVCLFIFFFHLPVKSYHISLTKSTLTSVSFVVPNLVIISVIRPPKTKTRCVRLPSSMKLAVRVVIVNILLFLTSFLNVLDFCLWAPSVPNKTVGQAEGEMVAWCSKPGHGTRLIPAGALTGLQFLKTPDYIQIVGFIDQTKINIANGDYGGEMDPHGADLVRSF